MWWCFRVTSSNAGVMEDIIVILMWRSFAKPITWLWWPYMVKAFFTWCVWWSEWCVVICVSSFWVPWYMQLVKYIQLVKWLFLPYVLSVSCVLCHMCWNLFIIFRCVVEGICVVSALVLLSIPPLYCSLFSFGVGLFTLEFSGCFWLLWLNISFNMSRKSFS